MYFVLLLTFDVSICTILKFLCSDLVFFSNFEFIVSLFFIPLVGVMVLCISTYNWTPY